MIRQAAYLEPEVIYEVLEMLYREVGELQQQLAPEGWNNSPYHFPFELAEGEKEVLYQTYDTVASAYERKFGPSLQQYISDGRYEIDYMTRAGSGSSGQTLAELIYLLELVIVQLTEDGRLFKADDDSVHYMIDSGEVTEESFQLCIDLLLPDTDDICPLVLSVARRDLLLYIGLAPIYALVFTAFRHAGYDWVYRNEQLVDLWELSQMDDIPTSRSDQPSIHFKNTLMSQIVKARTEMPPDAVLGYYEVYQRWPVGYPPTIDSLSKLREE